jgi:hypothetical protein
MLPPWIQGFIDEAKSAVGNSRAAKIYNSAESGASLFHRTVGKATNGSRNLGNAMLTHSRRLGGLNSALRGNTGMGVGGMWSKKSVLSSMGINAGVGATYGAMTSPDHKTGGAIKGAFMGAGMGLAGRGALTGMSKGISSGQLDKLAATKLGRSINMGSPSLGKIRGVYNQRMGQVRGKFNDLY